MLTLDLEVLDFVDDHQWRWRVSDSQGAFMADHSVSLDEGSVEYAAFVDMYGSLRWNAAPDSQQQDESTFVSRMAQWTRTHIWAGVGDAILDLAGNEPLVVTVRIPTEAESLLFRPFELGLVFDSAPGAQDVSLVFDLAGPSEHHQKQPIGEHLRMLALFSMPTDQMALNVRRERHELRRLVQRVAHTAERAIELRILQYGVTREVLGEVLEEGLGWDLIHFSGHGLPAGLVLEKEDGSADVVPSREFADLLWPARAHLKLVTLSSCESAATTAAHAMQLLGVDDGGNLRRTGEDEDAPGRTPLPAVAQEVVAKLDCAALAMRYPVEDEFAIKLTTEFYESLLAHGQPVARALQRALTKSVSSGEHPGLSVATPALFGAATADLKLKPPKGGSGLVGASDGKLAYFEAEPEDFVGRVGPLARASSAMAPKSSYRGVLFHGMAGAGKTACALELAYRHQDLRFEAMAWYRAPGEGQDITGALAQFAVALETQLDGLKFAHLVDSPEKLESHLPKLRELLANRSLLIVVDNIESLLTDQGTWRDPRWAMVMNAIIDHDGLSRVVLTSRVSPSDLRHKTRLRVETIHSLSAGESVLLARRLPNLGPLMLGGGNVGESKGRALVRRTLQIVQGNPKLLQLADRQAVDAAALEKRIAEAEKTWAGNPNLDSFFSTGEPDHEIDANDFLRVIERWTVEIVETLTFEEQLVFKLICALESADRKAAMIELAFATAGEELGNSGEPPETSAAIASIRAQGLVEIERVGEEDTLRLHPAIEEAGRQSIGEDFQSAVDGAIGSLWRRVHQTANNRADSAAISYSGLAAAPYLLRRGEALSAARCLAASVSVDTSTRTLASSIPLLERAVAITAGTPSEREVRGCLMKARTEQRMDDVSSELSELADLASAEEDYAGAIVHLTDLFNHLLQAGQLKEAQRVADLHPDLTRCAELGPWTELADEAMLLQIMHVRGANEEVLEKAEALRKRMDEIQEDSGRKELAPPWNVREGLLSVVRSAAATIEDWEQALEVNAEIRESEEARGASQLERSSTNFNDCGPFLALGRLDEAEAVLRERRQLLELAGDPRGLGAVFSAWAGLEVRRDRLDSAIEFEHRALRWIYRQIEPEAASVSHNNLASQLVMAKRDRTEVIAHRLAAALIDFQTESGNLPRTSAALAMELKRSGAETLPNDFESLCARVDSVDGVDFCRICSQLPQAVPTSEEAMEKVIEIANWLISQSESEG
jgi:hypothetical protein